MSSNNPLEYPVEFDGNFYNLATEGDPLKIMGILTPKKVYLGSNDVKDYFSGLELKLQKQRYASSKEVYLLLDPDLVYDKRIGLDAYTEVLSGLSPDEVEVNAAYRMIKASLDYGRIKVSLARADTDTREVTDINRRVIEFLQKHIKENRK